MGEIIDIFNEKYEWIGKEDRDVVHKEGYWHQSDNAYLESKAFPFSFFRS